MENLSQSIAINIIYELVQITVQSRRKKSWKTLGDIYGAYVTCEFNIYLNDVSISNERKKFDFPRTRRARASE